MNRSLGGNSEKANGRLRLKYQIEGNSIKLNGR